MSEPYILRETDDWAAVVKPHGMPCAPLPGREDGTLLSWFLSRRPEAASVIGRKGIERGLIHRLDTATWGIVLFAKSQRAYDALAIAQGNDVIMKRYVALCEKSDTAAARASSLSVDAAYPVRITSRFRPWGPKGREVRPLFPGDRGYEAATRDYETIVESLVPASKDVKGRSIFRASCCLTRGYRHQVRAHLAFSGFPIVCDEIYGAPGDGGDRGDSNDRNDLCLYAVEISFPSPVGDRRETVSLRPPDRTIP